MIRCHAYDDGYCDWASCPQLRDGEPHASARPCPIGVEAHIVALRFEGFTIAQMQAGLMTPATTPIPG